MKHFPSLRQLRPALFIAFLLGGGDLLYAQSGWTGALDNDWAKTGNWDGPAPATADDTALFTGPGIDPVIGVATTIGGLEFQSGAGAYTLTGAALTIEHGGSSPFISHSAGNLQTISNDLNFTLTSGAFTTLGVAGGSTLTLNGKLTVARGGTANDNSLQIINGGTVNMNGTLSGINQVSIGSGSTLNFNVSGGGFNALVASAGRLNLLKAAPNYTTIKISSSSGTEGSVYLSSDNVSYNTPVWFQGGSNSDLTFGADVSGGGEVTQAGKIVLNQTNANNTNSTYRLYAASGNLLKITGVIEDKQAYGAGTVVEISGPGRVQLAGSAANTFLEPVVVREGTLELAKTEGDAVGGVSLTIHTEAEVKLLGANQIADTTGIVLDGGRFNTNGFSETAGLLNVGSSGGTIDLGTGGGVFTFSGLGSVEGVLTITNWTENLGAILFNNIDGWTPIALGQVWFDGYEKGAILDGFELRPVPEPGVEALFGVAAGFAAVIWMRHSRKPVR